MTSVAQKRNINALVFNILVLLIGIMLVAVGGYMLFLRIRLSHLTAADFKIYFDSANNLRQGFSIYKDVNFQPPLTAILFTPLTLFPYQTALVIWSLLSTGLYFVMGWALVQELALPIFRRPQWVLVFIGLGLCWVPFQAQISLGQISILISAGIFLSWLLLRRKMDLAAGIILGLALLKLFPAIFAAYLLLRRRWSALAAMVVTVVIVGAMALLVVPPADFATYLTHIAANNLEGYAAFPVNVSLTGIFSKLFVNGPWVKPVFQSPELAKAGIMISSLAGLAVFAFQCWRTPKTPIGDDLLFGITGILMLFLSPLTWQHILTVLILPFGILLALQWRTASNRIKFLILGAFACVSLPNTEVARALMQWHAPYQVPWPAAAILLIPDVGLGLVWVLLSQKSLVSRPEQANLAVSAQTAPQ